MSGIASSMAGASMEKSEVEQLGQDRPHIAL